MSFRGRDIDTVLQHRSSTGGPSPPTSPPPKVMALESKAKILPILCPFYFLQTKTIRSGR